MRSLARLAGRLAAAALLAWALGLLWFLRILPSPSPALPVTDGIVVLTGGAGRVARGVDLIARKRGKRLLISGVSAEVRPLELARTLKVPPAIFDCCIDLGFEALDTRGNAAEVADWARANRFTSIRLVTSAYHLPRARLELEAQIDDDVRIIGDPVGGRPQPLQLAREYSKYLWRLAVLRLGLD